MSDHGTPPPAGYSPSYQTFRGPYPPALPEHPQGTTVLVLGILSLVTGVVAPFAWFYGNRAEKEIRASGLRYSNESLIQIGKILGIVGTILLGLGVLFVIAYFVFFLAFFLPLMSQFR